MASNDTFPNQWFKLQKAFYLASLEDFGPPPSSHLSLVREHFNCGFKPLNQYQEEAVKEALVKPFTLVQGPPGKHEVNPYLTSFFIWSFILLLWWYTLNIMLWTTNARRPVSRKPRKLFGHVKPFLIHLYFKTECMYLILLVWRQPLFLLRIRDWSSSVIFKLEMFLWLYGPEKFPGLSRNGPLGLMHDCLLLI